MRDSTQHDASMAVWMCIIAISVAVFVGLIITMGIGLLSPFGLGVVAAITGVAFVALLIIGWKESNRA